jgi:NADH-quinone oxidoreductase subunit A
MHFDFGSVLVFVGLAAAFLGATLALGKLVRPATPDARKGLVYECGEAPLGPSWFNFNPRFYLVALVFLVFDVEVAFTYPVAVVFRRWVASGRGAQAIVEIGVFIAVLVLGLGYVLAKGDLAWASVAKARTAGTTGTAGASAASTDATDTPAAAA